MSAFYHHFQHHATSATAPAVSHGHHGGRNRRAPRLSVSQNSHKQFRGVRSMKDLTETASLQAFRMKYEAGRSFDLEDDMEFCPNLLTDSDLMSIHSAASSERSSLASNSPEASPTQQPTQVAQPFSLNSSSPAFVPPTSFQQTQQNSQQQAAAAAAASQQLKLHQPAATRARNAIPIINPATGITMASPPPSVSPARMQPALRRW